MSDNESDDSDDDDGSYDDTEVKKNQRHQNEIPHGSRTNYKGHWSKDEVGLFYF